jgi:hypothetical protein
MTNILSIVLILGMGCLITGLVFLALVKIWSEE